MVDIQSDLMDVFARNTLPLIRRITAKTYSDPTHGFSEQEKLDIKFMLDLLEGFDGEMTEDSIAASVYNYWHLFVHHSFLSDQTVNGTTESKLTSQDDQD